jgi:hypothetical protein
MPPIGRHFFRELLDFGVCVPMFLFLEIGKD